ncbi:hypothetical protein [Streptomyces thermolilacinus]|uniref:hypothetical protein n=1 Tax=Streptomyces thermolilacinus TaxID=285540 RepID=UPI0033FD03FE
MADEPEEVKRLMEAIEAVAAIEDDAACAQAASKLLEEWPTFHSRLREIRQQRAQSLKAQGKTWAEVAAALGGVTPSRAQQIATGLRGTKRPPKKGSEE